MTFRAVMYAEFYINQREFSPYAVIVSPPTQVQCLVTKNVFISRKEDTGARCAYQLYHDLRC